jgi:SAM-dependent methyltransferase
MTDVYNRLHWYDYAYRYINHGVLTLRKWGRFLPSAGSRILEFGCGNGFLCKILAEGGFRVTAVDIAGGYDRQGYEFVNSLDDVSGEFDCVVSFDVLEHLHISELNEVLPRLGEMAEMAIHLIACDQNGPLHPTVMSPGEWLEYLDNVTAMKWEPIEVWQRHTEFDSPVLLVRGSNDSDS